jgi:hypothetical protein
MRENTKNILKDMGFIKEVQRVKNGQCPFCGSTKVKRENFKDELSWKEYKQSGMCGPCQDRTFTEE